MKINTLLTIIVPVYNTAEYLEQCIESIVSQKGCDFEVLLINDGSTDNSPEICDKWAAKYDFINVIHKPNGGLSDARNVGIANAKGEFLLFVDSDDWLAQDLLSNFTTVLHQHPELDIYFFNINRQFKYGWVVCHSLPQPQFLLDKNKILEYTFKLSGVEGYACNKIFRKNLFETVKFPKSKLYEDIFTIPKLIDSASQFYVDNRVGYLYRYNESGIMKSKFSPAQYDNIEQRLLLLGFIKLKYPHHYDLALEKLLNGFLSVGYKIAISEKNSFFIEFKNQLYNDVDKYFKAIMLNSRIDIKKRCAFLLLRLNFPLYRWLYKKYLGK